MNPTRAKWERLYKKAKADAPIIQRCPVCLEVANKNLMDAHHTRGRHGENILNFIYVHRACHDWIHNNVKEATEMGFMEPNR